MTDEDRWRQLTLAEQLGNVGSEVGRAAKWQTVNQGRFEGAVGRGLDLIDQTLADPRWQRHPRRLRELARLRELFVAASESDNRYHTTLSDLDRYLRRFALLARS